MVSVSTKKRLFLSIMCVTSADALASMVEELLLDASEECIIDGGDLAQDQAGEDSVDRRREDSRALSMARAGEFGKAAKSLKPSILANPHEPEVKRELAALTHSRPLRIMKQARCASERAACSGAA